LNSILQLEISTLFCSVEISTFNFTILCGIKGIFILLSVLRVKGEENLKSSFTNKIKLKVEISTEENKIVKLNSTFKSDTTAFIRGYATILNQTT